MTSATRFQRWCRGTIGREALTFSVDDLLGVDAATIDTDGFPPTWRQDDLELDLSYVFEPGADDDGVTVHVPLVLLPRLPSAGVDWLVPGHRHELVTALIRTLPKPIRRLLAPAPERAREALDGVGPGDGPLLEVLARRLGSLAGTLVTPADFDVARLPRHLRLRFSVEDVDGRVVAAGRDLDARSTALAEQARRAVAAATPGHLERRGLRGWPEGGLPRIVETVVDGGRAVAYPTLVDEGESVGVRIVTGPAEQERLMAAATRRLMLLAVPGAPVQVERRLLAELGPVASSRAASGVNDLRDLATVRDQLRPPHPGPDQTDGPGGDHGGIELPGPPELLADCLVAAADRLITARGGPAWDDESHRRLQQAAKDRLVSLAVAAAGQVAAIVAAAVTLAERLDRSPSAVAPAVADMRSHLARLVHPGFVGDTGLTRLPHLARYVEAIGHRLDKLRERPDRDRHLMARARSLEAAYDHVVARLSPARRTDDDVVAVRWMLEELRVSLFAQVLGTAQPVSEQRVRRALAALEQDPSR